MKSHTPTSSFTKTALLIDRALSRQPKPKLIFPTEAFAKYYRQATNRAWVEALAASISYLFDAIEQQGVDIPFIDHKIEVFNSILEERSNPAGDFDLAKRSAQIKKIYPDNDRPFYDKSLDNAIFWFSLVRDDLRYESGRVFGSAEIIQRRSLNGALSVVLLLKEIGIKDAVEIITNIYKSVLE